MEERIYTKDMVLITKAERNSILFYQGAVTHIKPECYESHLKDFYQIANAYEGLNTLLFPGISNEESRIRDEHREIPSVLLDYLPELLRTYCNLYSAMCKYAYFQEQKGGLYTYRCDRMNTLEFLKQGKTFSFLSTSLKHNGNPDFHKKNGILLLEIDASAGVAHLDVNEVLGDESVYPDEQEILFPPFLHLEMEELELTEDEKQYKDINNEMPKAKYKIIIKNSGTEARESNWDHLDIQKLYNEILEQESVDIAKKVWADLFKGEALQSDDVKKYQEWKKKIQIFLEKSFQGIKEQIYEINPDQERRSELKHEIATVYNETNRKRIKYKNQIKGLNIALSILYPLSSFAIALSFIAEIEIWAKIAGLLFAALSAILSGIGTGMSIEEKWQQRTTTYLRLDELIRDMKYETDWNMEKTDRYIDKFKDIIKADDAECENNTKLSANYFKAISKEKNKAE